MRIKALTLGLLAVGAVSAWPAQATVYTVTYTGTVTSGLDEGGVYAPVGSDLTGQTIVARYTFDDQTAGELYFNDGTEISIDGGSGIYTDPLIAASASIGSNSISFGGLDDYDTNTIGIGSETRLSYADTMNGNFLTSMVGSSNNFLNGLSLANSFAYNVQGGDSADGDVIYYNAANTRSQVFFNVVSVAVTDAPLAVPEPASWAMMIVGLGLAGAAMRRRGKWQGTGSIAMGVT